MGAFATTVSALYLGVMLFSIGTACLFCLGIDAINILIFLIAWTLRPRPLSSLPLHSGKWRVLAGIQIASLFVTVGGLSASFNQDLSDFPVAEVIQNTLAQPIVAVQTGPELPSMGPADAPITIVEFSDFQCPHCQRAAMVFHNLQLRKPGMVRVVFRNYPLDSHCNPKIQGAGGHQVACEAARGSYCAQKQGKFFAYYEQVFENQTDLKPGGVPEFAKKAGLDEVAFQSCLDSEEAKGAIERDLQEGDSIGIEGTPTILINGRKVGGLLPLPVWEKLIDRLGSPASQATPSTNSSGQ
jgi:protein-disulfide isomerase